MDTIYIIPHILTVYHEREKNYILLKWLSFNISLTSIRKMHTEILRYAQESSCTCFVADTSETVSVLSDEIIGWWRNTWIKVMNDAGIEKIITVLPENILAQQSTFDWQKGDYRAIKLYTTTSMERAEKLIREGCGGR